MAGMGWEFLTISSAVFPIHSMPSSFFTCILRFDVYFRHPRILPFCHFAILPFCHPRILPFCHFVILPFCHFAILPFCHFDILPFCAQVNVNLAGLPAIVVPCGLAPGGHAGLPIGLQMIGRAFGEVLLLNPSALHGAVKLYSVSVRFVWLLATYAYIASRTALYLKFI